MKFQFSYPFVQFVEKLPGETEQDFYMSWSYERVAFRTPVRLSAKSVKPALKIIHKLDKEKLASGLFEKCKNKGIGNVVCLNEDEFKEFIQSIKEDLKDRVKMQYLFDMAMKINMFEKFWLVLYMKEDGEYFERSEEDEINEG